MGRRGASTTALTGRQSEKGKEAGGGAAVHICIWKILFFGLGRCGTAQSNIQAGCARAHTAVVPVLWEHVQQVTTAELRPTNNQFP